MGKKIVGVHICMMQGFFFWAEDMLKNMHKQLQNKQISAYESWNLEVFALLEKKV